LETVRISNDVDSLGKVMARAGVCPEVVVEATYGWYWAADALADLGAVVHLAHPLGVKGSRTGGSRTMCGMPPTWRTC
jgi:pheromone shutdown protein TraB